MTRLQPLFLACLLLGLAPVAARAGTETIVFLRHGEKPEQGLGQLSCQGLNRAMALPKVLLAQFDKPAAIVAANPGIEKADSGVDYNYVRPLATIEPTAVRLQMPVKTSWGFLQTAELNRFLLAPQWDGKTIFVAWEHHLLRQAVKDLLAQTGGDTALVPAWLDDDYDALFVVKIVWDGSSPKQGSFELRHQKLDKLPATCPD